MFAVVRRRRRDVAGRRHREWVAERRQESLDATDPHIGGLWPRVAHDVGLPADDVIARVVRLTERIGEALAAAAGRADVSALGSDLPERLVDAVGARAEACARWAMTRTVRHTGRSGGGQIV